ncbi:MAG: helix-turn-helix transcriptional regulator [Paraclostridium sp.]
MNNKIQKLRKSKKITQEELGKMCGVSRQTIISIENGKYNPSILLAHKIAKIFNCIIEDVFIFDK